MRLLALTFALTGLLCTSLCAASAIPAYPYARSLDTRDASPVVAPRAAPSPSPSPRQFDEARIRIPKIPIRGRLQRRNTDEIVLSPAELSGHLCPQPMSVCPITKFVLPVTLSQWVRDGYECVDMQEDLTSCGGCGILDKKCVFDLGISPSDTNGAQLLDTTAHLSMVRARYPASSALARLTRADRATPSRLTGRTVFGPNDLNELDYP